jgi:hypothetical protein
LIHFPYLLTLIRNRVAITVINACSHEGSKRVFVATHNHAIDGLLNGCLHVPSMAHFSCQPTTISSRLVGL